MTRLTDIAIRNLKPKADRYEVPDRGARGLRVVVHPSGKTSFAVRYRHAGIPKKLTLQAGISLAAARKLAAEAMLELAQGRDPGEAKKEEKAKTAAAALNTVANVCEEYFRREHAKLRTAADRERDLRRLVFPVLGARQIDTVKRSEIVRLLDKIEDTSGARMADLTRAYLSRIFNWHAGRDDDFTSPIVKAMVRYSVKDNARERVLTDDELRSLWKAAGEAGYLGSCLKFLLLTAARRKEATALKWEEIGEDGVWVLPAGRHKTGVALARPLSRAALAIVAAQLRVGDYVFTFSGRRPAAHERMKVEVQRRANIAGWRLHDLRRTARTLMSRAGVAPDVAERCLGHALPGIRATYDRHSFEHEMAHAFEALAAEVDRVVNPPTGDVVTLRRRGHARA
jgi:integrase